MVSLVSGKPIGVANESTADGARIVQFSRDGSRAARWFLVDVGSGYLAIINVNSGKALDDTGGSTEDANPLQQWEFLPGDTNQHWHFISLGEYDMIVNRTSGLAIDLRDANTTDGAAIQQWEGNIANPSQHWRLVSS